MQAGIQQQIVSAQRTKPNLCPTSWGLSGNMDTGLRRYDVFFANEQFGFNTSGLYLTLTCSLRDELRELSWYQIPGSGISNCAIVRRLVRAIAQERWQVFGQTQPS